MSISKTVVRIGIRALAAAAFLMGAAPCTWATTLNFDAIPTPHCGTTTTDVIPGLYGGFTWGSGFGVECSSDYMDPAGSDNSYGAPSASNAVYNTFGQTPLLMTSGTAFQFDGAMFSGWTVGDLVDLTDEVTAQTVTVKGFLGGTGGTLVGTETLTLAGADSSLAKGYLAIGGIAGAIDTLVISTPVTDATNPTGNLWLMDDFQFETDANGGGGGGPAAVPEPKAVVLLGGGLVGLFALVRRKSLAFASNR